MRKNLPAFQVSVDGRKLDYRLGEKISLDQVTSFFSKKYSVEKIWQGQRHVLANLEKNGQKLFLKLATTEGISVLTKIEYDWNEKFNQEVQRSKSTRSTPWVEARDMLRVDTERRLLHRTKVCSLASSNVSKFWVPKNFDCGLYQKKLLYLITDRFEGELLVREPSSNQIVDLLISNFPSIIEFSESIQNLNLEIKPRDNIEQINYQQWFLDKTILWYKSIPKKIVSDYKISQLIDFVNKNYRSLAKKPRHGDFTPWHIFSMENNKLGLIDGEHALSSGVEYYDIGYFLQRVYAVLKNPEAGKKILSVLLKRNYDLLKLKTILSARAIGGYLDESLNPRPDYIFAENFQRFVLGL